MNFPDVSHQLSDECPDVMFMHHMGAALEDVGAPQLLDHPAREWEHEPSHDRIVREISQLREGAAIDGARTV
jgi:hypothetical protein